MTIMITLILNHVDSMGCSYPSYVQPCSAVVLHSFAGWEQNNKDISRAVPKGNIPIFFSCTFLCSCFAYVALNEHVWQQGVETLAYAKVV
jgi:hypothetical protein